MKVSASESGSGVLTVRELCEKLQGLPESAIVRFNASSDQRDGDIWSLRVEWDNDLDNQVNVSHLHSGPRIGDSLRRTEPPPMPEPTRFEGESEHSFKKRYERTRQGQPERFAQSHSYDQFNDGMLPPWQEG